MEDLQLLPALNMLSIGSRSGDAARHTVRFHAPTPFSPPLAPLSVASLPPQFLLAVLKDLAGLPQTYRDYSLAAGAPAPDAPALARAVRGLFADATRRGTPAATFSQRLAQAGVDEGAAAALAAVLFSERRAEVLAGALARAGAQLGGRPLLAWEWSVRHVLASSRVARLGESLLHLRLTLGAAREGGEEEVVELELSPREAQALVDALEAARAAALAC